MPYVRYFREGKEEGYTPWSGSIDTMKQVAAQAMTRHGLDRAEIVDEFGFVIWSRSAGGAETIAPPPNFVRSALRAVRRIAHRA